MFVPKHERMIDGIEDVVIGLYQGRSQHEISTNVCNKIVSFLLNTSFFQSWLLLYKTHLLSNSRQFTFFFRHFTFHSIHYRSLCRIVWTRIVDGFASSDYKHKRTFVRCSRIHPSALRRRDSQIFASISCRRQWTDRRIFKSKPILDPAFENFLWKHKLWTSSSVPSWGGTISVRGRLTPDEFQSIDHSFWKDWERISYRQELRQDE